MKINKQWLIVPLFLLQFGCNEYNRYQSPAPIYGGRSATNPYETAPNKPYTNDATTRPVAPEENIRAIESIPPINKRPQFHSPVMSPAVVALMTESDRNSRAGEYGSAVSVLERALRINPRNPTLIYKLATVRLKQSKPRLAEDLAKKAALLAAGDVALKRKSWFLISEARRMQGNQHGAKEAKSKAESLI